MNIEEIKKNAPDGATHYLIHKEKVFYFKGEMVWVKGVWIFATLSKDIVLNPL